MKRPSLSGLLSPRGLLVVAAALTSAYAVVHLAGWRESVSILSGTFAAGEISAARQIVQAGVYAGLYFSVVLLVPVLVLVALLQYVVAPLVLRRDLCAAPQDRPNVASKDGRDLGENIDRSEQGAGPMPSE